MDTAPFEWTEPREEAAQLLAEGRLSDREIAERAGCDRKTLWRWKRHPDFKARVDEHRDQFREEVRRRGLADRDRRIRALNDRWVRMQQVLEARADDPDLRTVPGGHTGLLVKTVRHRGSGENAETVVEAEVDVALLREIRETERQAAQELGQWSTRHEVSGPGGGPLAVQIYIPANGRDDVRAGDPAQLEAPGTLPQLPG